MLGVQAYGRCESQCVKAASHACIPDYLFFQTTGGSGVPDSASLNGKNCLVVQRTAPAPPPSRGGAEAAGSLTTSNGQIIGVNGQPLYLIGPNWFGFDDGNTMLDGLWEGSCLVALSSDFMAFSLNARFHISRPVAVPINDFLLRSYFQAVKASSRGDEGDGQFAKERRHSIQEIALYLYQTMLHVHNVSSQDSMLWFWDRVCFTSRCIVWLVNNAIMQSRDAGVTSAIY